MICPLCGYAMDAFDVECPRCHGKGVPKPASAPADPDSQANPPPAANPPAGSSPAPASGAPRRSATRAPVPLAPPPPQPPATAPPSTSGGQRLKPQKQAMSLEKQRALITYGGLGAVGVLVAGGLWAWTHFGGQIKHNLVGQSDITYTVETRIASPDDLTPKPYSLTTYYVGRTRKRTDTKLLDGILGTLKYTTSEIIVCKDRRRILLDQQTAKYVAEPYEEYATKERLLGRSIPGSPARTGNGNIGDGRTKLARSLESPGVGCCTLSSDRAGALADSLRANRVKLAQAIETPTSSTPKRDPLAPYRRGRIGDGKPLTHDPNDRTRDNAPGGNAPDSGTEANGSVERRKGKVTSTYTIESLGQDTIADVPTYHYRLISRVRSSGCATPIDKEEKMEVWVAPSLWVEFGCPRPTPTPEPTPTQAASGTKARPTAIPTPTPIPTPIALPTPYNVPTPYPEGTPTAAPAPTPTPQASGCAIEYEQEGDISQFATAFRGLIMRLKIYEGNKVVMEQEVISLSQKALDDHDFSMQGYQQVSEAELYQSRGEYIIKALARQAEEEQKAQMTAAPSGDATPEATPSFEPLASGTPAAPSEESTPVDAREPAEVATPPQEIGPASSSN